MPERPLRTPDLPPVLAGAPLLIAHRGGAGHAPENTLEAIANAVARWQVEMVELDVRATADGACVLMHDPTVDRTTDGTGRVDGYTLAELRRVDAGHRFTPDGGRTYPFRGSGVRVPLFSEVLERFPRLRIIVEIKSGDVQEPLQRALEQAGAFDRVILAGENEANRTRFADYPGVRSASVERLRACFLLHQIRCARFARTDFEVVQVPQRYRGVRVVTPAFVRALHAHRIPVHVWTVNEPAAMRRLLDWGVDGILTDYPDRLAAVLAERA